jgi:RimJ/RimL family protein N-acetyltransferase
VFLVPANAAGIALYEKFGFEIEGTHRRFAVAAAANTWTPIR